MDPKDHYVRLAASCIPDFTIIADFSQDLQNKIEDDPAYQELVKELDDRIPATGFEFHHHLVEDSPTNRWHPFHIRRPLLEVLRGTKTSDEQDMIMKQEAFKVLDVVLGSTSFRKLRETFSIKKQSTVVLIYRSHLLHPSWSVGGHVHRGCGLLMFYSGNFTTIGTIVPTGEPILATQNPGAAELHWALYTRRKDYVAAKLTYTAKFSGDLVTWQNSTTVPTVLADDGVNQLVGVPYPALLSNGQPPKFFRLTVGISP